MLSRGYDYARDFWRRKGPKTRTDKVIVYGSLFAVFVLFPSCGIILTTAYPSNDVDVTFVNETDGVAIVYIDGYFELALAPGERQEENIWGWGDTKLVEAIDEEGRLLFNRNLSREQLDEIKKSIVIRDLVPMQ